MGTAGNCMLSSISVLPIPAGGLDVMQVDVEVLSDTYTDRQFIHAFLTCMSGNSRLTPPHPLLYYTFIENDTHQRTARQLARMSQLTLELL
jgi:hypothetical protein